MRVFNKLNGDQFDECTVTLNASEEVARETYRKMNALIVDFIRDLGGAEHLPTGFDVQGEGWYALEAKIDEAAGKNQPKKTKQFCDEYLERVERYLNIWRQKLLKRRGA